MFRYFSKVLNNSKTTGPNPQTAISSEDLKTKTISASFKQNMDILQQIIGLNSDLVTRNFTLGRTHGKSAAIIYIDNMMDPKLLDNDIVRPLVLDAYTSGLNSGQEIIEQIQAGNLIARAETSSVNNFQELLAALLSGKAVLLIDGVNQAYIISTKGYKFRNIAESDVEPVVKGPREAFIEVLPINIGLIRKRINNPNLVFESMELGVKTKTRVCMAYIKGTCPTSLSDEVRSRLKRISLNEVLASSYIEENIQDHPYTIFPQVRNTERPDVVAASLLEGRAAILIDNTPVTLIVPGEFFSLMQAAEDYYNQPTFSSLLRILRYFALVLAIFLPALYIAITNYHQEMIPTGLLISIISSRANVPFPAIIEALIMEVTFEILREAGVRLPRPIGQAVSIVGALVIGQAAIQATIVSPLMVIVVSLTGISNFCIPQFNISLPIRIIRFTLMIAAAVLGLFGLMIGTLFLMMHLFSLESFGKPYMAPLSPLRTGDLKNTIIRLPWWTAEKRPPKQYS